VAGAVQVDVTDGRGRHDGPYPDPNYRGIIEQRIPDSTYDGEIITGTGGTDVTTFFVSRKGAYTFALKGVTDTAVTFRLTAFDQKGVEGVVLFPHVPVREGGTARFAFQTDQPPSQPSMEVSEPGGGTTAVSGAVLDAITASDRVAPTTTASVDNGTVFVAAIDEGGSGLARTWVSTGAGFSDYTDPFPLPKDAKFLMAFSIDRNGNTESPGTVIPALGLGKSSIRFTVTTGQTVGPKSVKVLNLDPMGITGSIGWTASEDVPWLTVSPAAGETPGSIALTVNAAGLAAGTYTGTVVVKATTSGVLFPVRRLKVRVDVTAG